MEIRNARIESAALGIEDHGILTIDLQLDYGDSSHQSFGGYSLGGGKDSDGKYLHRWVMGMLNTVDVSWWSELKGQHIRVEREDGWNGKITRIGHITKDKWFSAVEPA